MSLWFSTRDKKGRRHWWAIGTDPTAVVSAITIIVLWAGSNLMQCLLQHPWVPFVLAGSGLAFLVIAKVSLYRQGIWLSFGPGLMARKYASLYKVAYVLIGVGVLLMLLLLGALRLRT
jgi:hypothetical protein